MTTSKAVNSFVNRLSVTLTAVDETLTSLLKGVFRLILPLLSLCYNIFKRFFPLFNSMDRIFGKMLPYVVILVMAVFVAVSYLGGSMFGFHSILELIGIISGVIVASFIYQTLNQEKTIQFLEGEKVHLQSRGDRTYTVVTSIGDVDVPFEPVRSTLYLTNLGIVVERINSGETTFFIPLDRITEIGQKQGGIRIRSVDFKRQFIEVMIFVEDKEQWMQALNEALINRITAPVI